MTIAPMSLEAGNNQLIIAPLPENAAVAYVHRLKFINETGSLGALAEPPPYAGDAGKPRAFYLEEPGVVRLHPTPKIDYPDALTVEVTLLPASPGCIQNAAAPDCLFPDYFWTHHREAIRSGVLGRMQLTPRKPWTDASAGALNERRFRNFIRRSRVTSGRRWGMAVQTWRFPEFASGRFGVNT